MSRILSILIFAFGIFAIAGCSPSYPKCHTDQHCQTDGRNEWCVGGMCKMCRDDSHCSKTNPCMECGTDRTCSKKAKCCMSDAECPGEKCWKNESSPALPGECGDVCLRVTCPEGQKCVGGSCVPNQECLDDAGCPQGHKCVNGSCVKSEQCVIQTIYFDFNESAIRLDQEATIKANAACLKQLGTAHTVVGHCDERGDSEYNLALGQRRANSVIRQYKTLGVDGSNLSGLSKGEEDPVCAEHTQTCYQQNRRVQTLPRP